MREKNELLANVAERYLYHKNYSSENPFMQEIANKMCEVEVDEMWMLTQNFC